MKQLSQLNGFKFSNVLNVKSPYTAETVYEVPIHTIEQSIQKLSEANQKQKMFNKSSLEYRIDLMNDAKTNLTQKQHEICEHITQSMGKPLKQAQGEFNTMIQRMDALIEMSRSELQDDILIDNAQVHRKIKKEAKGNVMLIAPWNYPLICLINTLAAAVLAGNTVHIKHSPYTGTIGQFFEDAFSSEPFIVNNYNIDVQNTQQLMKHSMIDMVSFTGSVQTGLSVLEQSMEHQYTYNNKIMQVGLELGGKDGFYIRNDISDDQLAQVAAAIIDGATYNSGQSCCSVERVYVHQDIYQKFVTHCEQAMDGFKMGNPLDSQTNFGPMTLPDQPQYLQQQIEDSVSMGATVIKGGMSVTDSQGLGSFYEPTLIIDCDNGMSVFQEESFGPIVAIGSVQNDQDAINSINDSKYGLTAGVYTTDRDFAESFASQVNAGTIFMNKCDYLDPYLPWNGRKLSGAGLSLSKYSFSQVTNVKGYNFVL